MPGPAAIATGLTTFPARESLLVASKGPNGRALFMNGTCRATRLKRGRALAADVRLAARRTKFSLWQAVALQRRDPGDLRP